MTTAAAAGHDGEVLANCEIHCAACRCLHIHGCYYYGTFYYGPAAVCYGIACYRTCYTGDGEENIARTRLPDGGRDVRG